VAIYFVGTNADVSNMAAGLKKQKGSPRKVTDLTIRCSVE